VTVARLLASAACVLVGASVLGCSKGAKTEQAAAVRPTATGAQQQETAECDAPRLQAQCTAGEYVTCARLGYCFAHGDGMLQNDGKAVEL
jgi:glucose-6-phosphate dehydrogenase assembly protein OpcA